LFEKFKNLLEIDSYVLDLVYVPVQDICLLIELNHWSKTTSSSLFSWEDDIEVDVFFVSGKILIKETKVLENGPFDFRFLRDPIPNVRSLIAAPLREMAGWKDVPAAQMKKSETKQKKKKKKNVSTKKDGAVGRCLEKEASKWKAVTVLDDKTYDALQKVMNRREQPFFTFADVSLLPVSRFLRGEEGAEPSKCAMPTMYVTLFARIAGRPPFVAAEVTLAKVTELDVHNSALVLKELGLIEKK